MIGDYKNSESFVQLGPAIPFSLNINILFTGYEKCNPSHYAGPCYKKAYLMHLVLGGKGIFRCNDKEYNLKKGDIFIINPTDYIFYQSDENEPLEYRWLKFEGNSVQYLFENAGINRQVYCIDNEQQFETMLQYYVDIFDLMRDETAPYLRATGMFYLFLGWFMNAFGEKRIQTAEKMGFVKILNYINQHFAEDINMDILSKISNYNRSHIYKIFIKNLGCSPKEYINNLRLNLACEMLQETKYSISEISMRTGFNNYISFINAFKKKYEKSPKEYRETEDSNQEKRINENE